MLVVAAATVSRRGTEKWHSSSSSRWPRSCVRPCLTLGVLFGLGIFELDARTLIPLAGLMVGNSMTATVVVARRVYEELRDKRDEVEARLALGQPASVAAQPYVRSRAANRAHPADRDRRRPSGSSCLPGAMTGPHPRGRRAARRRAGAGGGDVPRARLGRDHDVGRRARRAAPAVHARPPARADASSRELTGSVTTSWSRCSPGPRVRTSRPIRSRTWSWKGRSDGRRPTRCSRTLPAVDFLTEGATYGSNEYFVTSAGRTLHHGDLAPVWRDFTTLHSSPAFAREIFALFGDLFPGPVRAITEGLADDRLRGARPRRAAVRWGDARRPDRAQHAGRGPADVGEGRARRPSAGALRRHLLPAPRRRPVHRGRAPAAADARQQAAKVRPRVRARRRVRGRADDPVRARHVRVLAELDRRPPPCEPASETPRFRCYANLLAEVETPWYDWRPYQRDPDAQRPKGRRKSLAQRIKARIR